MLYFHVMLKKYDICINADVLPKCPKIGITVGSLLKVLTHGAIFLATSSAILLIKDVNK